MKHMQHLCNLFKGQDRGKKFVLDIFLPGLYYLRAILSWCP